MARPRRNKMLSMADQPTSDIGLIPEDTNPCIAHDFRQIFLGEFCDYSADPEDY
ncbi:MAG: hypothetical protein L2C94_002155 [Aigarchaeota archaeon]|nr:hypothetical protein [Candidatus Wolframiiraptor gerlachensis]